MLDQRLRRWLIINPSLGECAMFAGKALLSLHAWGSMFRAPLSSITVSFQTHAHVKSIGGIINS